MQINPDLAHMTPARAKELLAGDIEGYRLPIIELIERQAAEIELLKDAGAWRGLTEQVHALQTEIERLRAGIRQWASECTGCDGTGTGLVNGMLVDCEDCADIRALLSETAPHD